jgi:hypothetical protein
MRELKLWVRSLHPRYWNVNYSVDKHWDKRLRSLINANACVERLRRCVGKIGGFEVWIGNYPYAFGSPYESDCLPRRRTIIMLKDYLAENDIYI